MSLPGDGRFFLPGPTEVHPDVLAAQNRPLISHRGPEMDRLWEGLQAGLRSVLATDRPVWISTSSATALMEAGVRSSGAVRVLCLVEGAFSQRFARIASRSGLTIETVEVPWGDAHDPVRVGEAVKAVEPELVTMVHSETSTGVLHPVPDLIEAIRSHGDPLIVVDTVSSAGGVAVEPDRWGVDLLLTGSQKAFALPPGLAFAVASERMVERARANTSAGLYLDVSAHYEALASGKALTTPAVTLLYALEEQLRRIAAEGVTRRFQRHAEMAALCHRWAERHARDGASVRLSAAAPHRSPTVTVLRLTDHRDSASVMTRLAPSGYRIASGYGKWRNDHLRIGHMGDHTPAGLEGLLSALDEALISAG